MLASFFKGLWICLVFFTEMGLRLFPLVDTGIQVWNAVEVNKIAAEGGMKYPEPILSQKPEDEARPRRRRRRSVTDYDYYDIMTAEPIPHVPASVIRKRVQGVQVQDNPFSDYEEVNENKNTMEKDVLVSGIVQQNPHRVCKF